MIRTTTKTPRPRLLSSESMWRMLLAICGVHGIPVSLREEVAGEIATNIYRTPRGKAQALAHRIVRRCVEGDLGMAPWTIPESSIVPNAIVQYEYARIIRGVWQAHGCDDEDWIGAFDYQTRRFAIEYGVCPRCGAAGAFGAGGGGCECGYSC